jgi:hypothetical protein
MLTATSTLQIDMAKETIHKTLTDIIENINYYSLVDLYYYAYVKYLTKVSIQQSKQKIFGNVFWNKEIYGKYCRKCKRKRICRNIIS